MGQVSRSGEELIDAFQNALWQRWHCTGTGLVVTEARDALLAALSERRVLVVDDSRSMASAAVAKIAEELATPSSVLPHEPPMVYDPKVGKMVKPGGDKLAWIEEEMKDGDRICEAAGVRRTEGGRLPVSKIINKLNAANSATSPTNAHLASAPYTIREAEVDGIFWIEHADHGEIRVNANQLAAAIEPLYKAQRFGDDEQLGSSPEGAAK